MKKKRLALIRQPAKKGFTLLEILVVAGILSLLSVVISQVFFLTVRVNKKTEVVKDVNQNGEYALETMSRTIQNAQSFDKTPCVEKEETPNIVDRITITNFDGQTTTFMCLTEIDGGPARIASVSASGVPSYLTNTNVTLVDPANETKAVCGTDAGTYALGFTCLSNNGKPVSVTISYTLRQINPSASIREKASASFKNTVVLRN